MVAGFSVKNIAIVTPSFFYVKFSGGAIETLKRAGALLGRGGNRLLVSLADKEVRWANESSHATGGLSIGFSPAVNREESQNSYREGNPWIDLTVYTGAGDIGHLANMVESADFLFLPLFDPVLVPIIEIALQRSVPVVICGQENREAVIAELRKKLDAGILENAKVQIDVDLEACLENFLRGSE